MTITLFRFSNQSSEEKINKIIFSIGEDPFKSRFFAPDEDGEKR